MVAARLKPGVSLQQADQDVRAIASRAERAFPQTNYGVGAFASPLREHFVGDQRVELMALCGAVGFVLLIACANISNLLLSRACNRKHEMAIRTAIGANNWHILRQLFAENLLLASAGAVCGLMLTKASISLLQRLVPDGITAMQPISMDLRVLAFTLAVALFTTVLFGLFPFLQVFRLDIQQVLKQGGARDGGGRGTRRVEGTLVVSQVALAFVLMLGALLMIQAYGRLRDVDPGFRTSNLLTMETPLSRTRYDTLAKRTAYYDEVLRRVTALPGVVSAGFANHLPIAFKGDMSGVTIEGKPSISGTGTVSVDHRVVTSNYLQTIGVPLHTGRYLNDADNAEALPVALINETMQRKYWPNENPVGKRFAVGPNPWITVVGVVGDMKEGLNLPAQAEMYFPATQTGAATSLAIHTRGNPALLSGAVRQIINSIDPDQPITHESTMEEILDKSVSPRQVQMLLLSTFAGLAVLLAGIGIYGVLAYVVAQRQREIGIRMALGARPASILQSIVGQGVTLSAIGIAIGVCAALSLARPVSQLLFNISFTDPLTVTSTAALLLGIACLASYIPARRAMKVDPLVALRND
jgi:putative ABC transport system permease protein